MLLSPITELELRVSNEKLRKSVKEKKKKDNSIEIVMIDDRQIIENVLQSAKCCCCDLQIGLTLCFIWILMCSMPDDRKWYLSIVPLLQVLCMIIGIICIWRAKRKGLTVAKVAIYVNCLIQLAGGVLFILHCFQYRVFYRIGNFLPRFMRIRRQDIIYDPHMLILWSAVIIFNIIMQIWIIVSINRAIKAIDHIKNKDDKSFVL